MPPGAGCLAVEASVQCAVDAGAAWLQWAMARHAGHRGSGMGARGLSHQLLEHEGQDAALVVVRDLDWRVDAQLECDALGVAIDAMDQQRDILLWRDAGL